MPNSQNTNKINRSSKTYQPPRAVITLLRTHDRSREAMNLSAYGHILVRACWARSSMTNYRSLPGSAAQIAVRHIKGGTHIDGAQTSIRQKRPRPNLAVLSPSIPGVYRARKYGLAVPRWWTWLV